MLNSKVKRKKTHPPESQTKDALFFGGIPKTVPYHKIEKYFSQFGILSFFKIEKDRYRYKKSEGEEEAIESNDDQDILHRGCGFVKYSDPDVKKHVLSQRHYFEGKRIDIKIARSKKERRKYEMEIREEKRKIYVGDLTGEYTKGKLEFNFSGLKTNLRNKKFNQIFKKN